MLDCLPAELLLEIISLLSLRDSLALCGTCRGAQAVLRVVPTTFYRHWVLQYLNLVQGDKRVNRGQQDQDWRVVMGEVHSLFGRLAKCPPPGCGIQKYLRWLQGRPTDCNIVRRVLVGVSMLPPSFREMIEVVRTDKTKVCFTERSKIVLNWMFPKEKGYQIKLEKVLEVEKPVGNFFNFTKFQTLLEYVIGETERLRLVMAEYHQIASRGLFEDVGFSAWTRPATILAEIDAKWTHGRQMGAFLDLIMLNNQAPGIRFWA